MAPYPRIMDLCKEALSPDQSSSELEQVTSKCEFHPLEGMSGATWQGHCWDVAGRRLGVVDGS